MVHRPERYKGLLMFVLEEDLVRAAISILVLLGLYVAGAPLWAVVIVPIVSYVGLWLLAPGPHGAADLLGANPRRPLRPADALGEIRTARSGIAHAAQSISDPESAANAEAIANWIDRSVDVIQEDGAPDAHVPLLELARFTNDLLSGYVKLCRRGLADSRTHEQMRKNLANLEARFRWFWEQLNRHAIIDLEALGAAVELFMNTMPSALDRDDAPTQSPQFGGSQLPVGEIPIGSHRSIELNGHGSKLDRERSLIATLTPRETEALRLIAAGRTNQQIADLLFISKHTVAKHVENICGKLQVQNRTEAAAIAIRNGLVE